MKKYYCKVPEWNAVFRVNEGCCYEKVVYAGEEVGIVPRFDKADELNGILLCRCDPKLEIIQISEQEYYTVYRQVNQRRMDQFPN